MSLWQGVKDCYHVIRTANSVTLAWSGYQVVINDIGCQGGKQSRNKKFMNFEKSAHFRTPAADIINNEG